MDNAPLSRRWFARFAKRHWDQHILPLAPFSSYLELGTHAGDSLAYAAEYLIGEGGAAIGVDPYLAAGMRTSQAAMDELYECTALRMSRWNRDGKIVRLVRQPSCEYLMSAALLNPSPPHDIVYVDAQHHAIDALTDIVLAWRLLKPCGLLVLDDCHLRSTGRRAHLRTRLTPHVYEAFQAFKLCFAGKFEVVYQVTRNAAVRKLI